MKKILVLSILSILLSSCWETNKIESPVLEKKSEKVVKNDTVKPKTEEQAIKEIIEKNDKDKESEKDNKNNEEKEKNIVENKAEIKKTETKTEVLKDDKGNTEVNIKNNDENKTKESEEDINWDVDELFELLNIWETSVSDAEKKIIK